MADTVLNVNIGVLGHVDSGKTSLGLHTGMQLRTLTSKPLNFLTCSPRYCQPRP